jgi:hypothetical protein
MFKDGFITEVNYSTIGVNNSTWLKLDIPPPEYLII